MACLGWLLQRGILERSARSGELIPILSTFGLAIVVENCVVRMLRRRHSIARAVCGVALLRQFRPRGDPISESWRYSRSLSRFCCWAACNYSSPTLRLDAPIRATAEDPDTVELVGVNSRFVNAVAASIALVTVGLAGLFLALRSNFDPYSGRCSSFSGSKRQSSAAPGVCGAHWRAASSSASRKHCGAHIHPQGFLLAGHGVFLLVLVGRLYISRPALCALSSNQSLGVARDCSLPTSQFNAGPIFRSVSQSSSPYCSCCSPPVRLSCPKTFWTS